MREPTVAARTITFFDVTATGSTAKSTEKTTMSIINALNELKTNLKIVLYILIESNNGLKCDDWLLSI